MKKETSKKIRLQDVETARVEIGWFIADAYLDGLAANASELFGDDEYKKRFDALRTYVNRQLYGGDEFNMVDVNVTIYREKCN